MYGIKFHFIKLYKILSRLTAHIPLSASQTSKYNTYFRTIYFIFRLTPSNVFFRREAIVIGPTPPGTGVI